MNNYLIADYAKKYKRAIDNNFASACYELSLSDLTHAIIAKRADATDCRAWGITATEWRHAILAALNQRLVDSGLMQDIDN